MSAMNERPVQAVVVEDSEFMRTATTAYLRQDPQIVVVAEVSTPQEALGAIAAQNQIDVVVLDLRLSGSSVAGIELATRLTEERPQVRIVIYTALIPDATAEPLPWNVRGYVLKTDRPSALIEAVKTVARGGTYVSEEVRPLKLRGVVFDNGAG